LQGEEGEHAAGPAFLHSIRIIFFQIYRGVFAGIEGVVDA
jgi:hypothetical protein